MPLRLCNTASSFQHFIDKAICDLHFVYAYINDLIASSPEAEHESQLQ